MPFLIFNANDLDSRGLIHHATQTSSGSSTPTCPADPTGPAIVPIINNLTSHQLAEIIGGASTALSILITLFLIFRHATHFSVPAEQKQIIRVIFTIPVFAVVSLLCVIFEGSAIYLTPIRDVYEAFAFVSIYQLICAYINSDGAERAAFLQANGHSSLYKRANIMVYQFPIVMIIVLIATEITEAIGKYCLVSSNVHFAHIWLEIIRIVSTVLAFTSLLRFYGANKSVLKGRHPMAKLAAFKGIIFLNVVQTAIFSFLSSSNDLNPTEHFSYLDLSIALPALLVCLEMLIFTGIHSFVYRIGEYKIPAVRRDEEGYVERGYWGFAYAIWSAINISDILGGMVGVFAHLGSKVRR